MKTYYKIILVILLTPALILANSENFHGKYTKEKSIKKEFTVNPDAILKISNSYGNVDIVTWDENRTVIEVTIRTNGNDEKQVAEKLDDITVEFSASASSVSAKTIFDNGRSNWNFWGSKNNKISMEIHYQIKMPINNSLNLDNDYGAISINKLKGVAKISCDYGQLIIGDLMADNNYLNFDYTDKSTIAYMKSGKINADYSGFTLLKTENLDLVADYTTSEISEVNKINYNCDYGKIKIGTGKEIVGRGDYLTTLVGSVSGSLNINSDYGSISIGSLLKNSKSASIVAEYTQVNVGFSDDASYDFDIKLNYASLSGESFVTIMKADIQSNDKNYSGYYNQKNSGNTLTINSNYGGVTLIKN